MSSPSRMIWPAVGDHAWRIMVLAQRGLAAAGLSHDAQRLALLDATKLTAVHRVDDLLAPRFKVASVRSTDLQNTIHFMTYFLSCDIGLILVGRCVRIEQAAPGVMVLSHLGKVRKLLPHRCFSHKDSGARRDIPWADSVRSGGEPGIGMSRTLFILMQIAEWMPDRPMVYGCCGLFKNIVNRGSVSMTSTAVHDNNPVSTAPPLPPDRG